jgi:hypothetical protein
MIHYILAILIAAFLCLCGLAVLVVSAAAEIEREHREEERP